MTLFSVTTAITGRILLASDMEEQVISQKTTNSFVTSAAQATVCVLLHEFLRESKLPIYNPQDSINLLLGN